MDVGFGFFEYFMDKKTVYVTELGLPHGAILREGWHIITLMARSVSRLVYSIAVGGISLTSIIVED